MNFQTLYNRIRTEKGLKGVPDGAVILCFDPGHTTGWAKFVGTSLEDSGEIDTDDMQKATVNVGEMVKEYDPDVVVIEDYRGYRWRQEHHVGSQMLTTRVIGSIETLAVLHGCSNIIKQPANVAKGFCSDKKLKDWGFYIKGKRHERDAIRHGCYYILFGAIQRKQKGKTSVG